MVDASMDDALRYLPLSAPQFQILLALTDADRHGYGIILNIAERTGGAMRIGTGTMYTALAGLMANGLIAAPRRRPAAKDDDRRRRYYTLTALGRAVLQAEATRLESLVRQAHLRGITTSARPAWKGAKP